MVNLGEKIQEFKINIRSFKASELTVPDYNPRKNVHDNPEFYEDLYDSIVRLGYIDAIVVNVRDGKNVIVGGNQRYRTICDIAEENGVNLEDTMIDAIVVDYDETTEMTANIALNKVQGDWLTDKLKEDLEFIKSMDEKMFDTSGFTEEELNQLTSLPDPEEEIVIKEFKIHISLPKEYEDIYDFYINLNGEDKIKKEIIKVITGGGDGKK